jgi:hypothetical protein
MYQEKGTRGDDNARFESSDKDEEDLVLFVQEKELMGVGLDVCEELLLPAKCHEIPYKRSIYRVSKFITYRVSNADRESC